MQLNRLTLPALLIAAATVLTGCSGDTDPAESEGAKADGISAAQFAQTSCSGWTKFEAANEEGLSTAQLTELTGSGEEQRAAVVGMAEAWLGEVQTQHDAMAAAVPGVEGGDAIAALFTDYYGTVIEKATPLIDEFREYSTELGGNGDEVEIGAIQLFSALKDTDSGLDFPFLQIEDQDLIGALGEENSCAGVVSVYGG